MNAKFEIRTKISEVQKKLDLKAQPELTPTKHFSDRTVRSNRILSFRGKFYSCKKFWGKIQIFRVEI